MAEISPYADEAARKKAEEIAALEEQLKPTTKSFTVVGTSRPRVDAREKVSGRAVYTGDIQLSGMLYSRVARSTRHHARIKKVDTSKAEAYPGVKAVITFKDAPQNTYTWPPELLAIGYGKGDMPILGERVRYRGEPIAGVAAESEDAAEEAVKLIEAEYEDLPAVFDIDEAMEPDAPLVHDGGNQAGYPGPMPADKPYPRFVTRNGDVNKGFAEADFIIEDTYSQPRPRQACTMEPVQFIAKWDGDKLTAWASSQAVHNKRVFLATWLGLPLHKVRIISPYVGGGFGSKANVVQEEPVACLLAMKTGRPVKMTYGVLEYATMVRPSEICRITVKAGFKNDGSITALQMLYLLDSGAYADISGFALSTGLNLATELFRTPNYLFEGRLIYTNTVTSGGIRGFGSVHSAWAVYQVVNQEIDRLGIDPLEYYVNHCTIAGDRVWALRTPQVHNKVRDCLREVARRAGWKEKWHKPGAKTLPNGRKHGIGASFLPYYAGSLWARPATVIMETNEDGTFKVLTGASEIGSGQKTVIAMLTAEVLKIDPDDIDIVMSDTAVTPLDTAQTGNRTTQCVGNAVVLAAEDVKKQLFELAAKLLKTTPDKLDTRNKKIFVKNDPQKGISFADALRRAPFVTGGAYSITGLGIYNPPLDVTFSGPIAIVVEVEVDTETGEVIITKVTSTGDTGTPINRATVESQALGAMYCGIGYALFEESLIDAKTKDPLNPFPNPWYTLPTIKEVENMEPFTVVDSYFPLGPLGAKGGTSEGGMYGIPHAIVAAIHNATGVWMREAPVTPDRLLKALGKVRQGKA